MSGSDNRPFEPPPWEKEQFEELARRRAAEQGGAAGAPAAAPPQSNSPGTPVRPGGTGSAAEGVEPGTSSAAGTGKALPAETDVLLARLRSEEQGSAPNLWRAGATLTVFVGIVGAVLLVWGITALATIGSTGATGVTGGSIMIFFGLFFIGVAAWMGDRIMRQRGVL